MRILSEQNYNLMEYLISLSQQKLHKMMCAHLKKRYNTVIEDKDYIVAVGDIPIALVAHMDTVFYNEPSALYYDQARGVMWSPEGAGFDDRAGIFAILQILKTPLRPSIILTHDEEKGGLGAQKLAKKGCPIPNLKYLIQLDRQGVNDCVFYDCYNTEFMEYVSSFGFTEEIGSYSDISFLMPAWNISGVNLSIGYKNEHTTSEILKVNALFDTIEKVVTMLTETEIPNFEFKTVKNPLTDYWKQADDEFWYADYGDSSSTYADVGTYACDRCKKYYYDFELIPVKGVKPHERHSLCPDCLVERKVEWCAECSSAYIPGEEDIGYCQTCLGGERTTNV